MSRPSDGPETLQFTNSVRVSANSYIWQPWFGNWRANVSASHSEVDAEQDSTADILTGDIRVNLFQRSHFPFTAFLGVQDSRVAIGDLEEVTSDLRTTRFNLTQQYQDAPNNTYYFASFDHDEQENLSSGAESVSDRVLLSADYNGNIHDLTGVALVNQVTTSPSDTEVTSAQGTLAHTFRPYSTLSVTTSGSISGAEAKAPLQDSENEAFSLATSASWNPAGSKLQLNGDASVSSSESDSRVVGGSASSRSQEEFRSRLSAQYDYSDNTTFFAEVGADELNADGESTSRTFQNVSVDYRSDTIKWGEYDYNYTAGALAGNTTDSSQGDNQFQSVTAGHSITRGWLSERYGPVSMVFNASQDASFTNDGQEGTRQQITHRAGFGASQSLTRGTRLLQVNVFDIRDFGTIERGLTSLSVNASETRNLTRYKSLTSNASYNWNMSSSDGDSETSDSLVMEARYFDSRLFGVNRLTLESTLRGELENLFTKEDDGDQGRAEIEWDNELIYRIGLLEVNSRAVYVQTRDRHNIVLSLGLIRGF